MRANSREYQGTSSLQRTGMQTLKPPDNATLYQPNSMMANQPIYSQANPYNYSQYYDQPTRYRPESGSMNPVTMDAHGNIQAPVYQSIQMQKKAPDMRTYDQNRSFVQKKNDMYDQLSTLNNKTVQKTPEQIINEFKAYTLPKLRLKRLIKLQALMKSYHVRRFQIPRLKQKWAILKLTTEDFLRKSLYKQYKIIPDIVMEVVAFNKYHQDLSLYSDQHRVYLIVIDELLNRAVRSLCDQVVREQTDYLVTSILNQRLRDKPQSEKDPMKLLSLIMIQNFIQKEVVIYAKDCIKELSSDYFKVIQYQKVMRDMLIPNTVRYVTFEALDEIILEKYLDSVINNLIKELAS